MGWLREHSIRAHILAPIWVRVPEKVRWRIVDWLNRSQKRCWCDLVDAALAQHRHESDPCNISTPFGGDRDFRCKTICDWSHPDHTGEHACSCYCAKFQFRAAEGAIDRRTASASSGATTGGDE